MSQNFHPTFAEWLHEQHERTDDIGQLARDAAEMNKSPRLWLYSLLDHNKAAQYRRQTVRAFVEYQAFKKAAKAGNASLASDLPRFAQFQREQTKKEGAK